MFFLRELKDGTAEREALRELRYKVLRQPLGLEFSEEELRREAGATHLGLFRNEELVGGLLLHWEGPSVHLRQMAVTPPLQLQGGGRLLLEKAEELARQRGYRWIHLHARTTVLGFYLRNGYQPEGTPFTQVGLPHQRVTKRLNPRDPVRQ